MINNLVFLNKKDYQKLPSVNGVYVFFQKEEILYIGKSNNLKARITAHWRNAQVDRKESLIMSQTDKIGFSVTDSEFNALVLEAQLINQYQPKYNVVWKDNKSHLYIKINIGDLYPKIYLVRKEAKRRNCRYFGPFSSVKTVEEILRTIRKIFPFCQQKKIGNRPCFYSKIGLCFPCPSNIEKEKDIDRKKVLKKIYRNNITQIIRILEAKSKIVEKNLHQKIRELIKVEDYEQAIDDRNKLLRLQLLLKQHLPESAFFSLNLSKAKKYSLLLSLKKYFPKLKKLHRIEAYDISNFSFKETTASMVVFKDGIADKSLYKRFKIKDEKIQSDFYFLLEVIKRRLANNWAKPDLIVIDGGKPQLSIIDDYFKKQNVTIPLIAIAKNPDRIIAATTNWPKLFFKSNNPGFLLIREIRDEAHRFARKYHLFLRKRNYKY